MSNAAFLILLLLASSPTTQDSSSAKPPKEAPEPVDEIVAIVNRHVITRREIELKIGSALKAAADPERAKSLWRNELKKAIEAHLACDAAKERGIIVDPRSVDREMRFRMEKAGGKDTFAEWLTQNGQTESQFREELEKDLLRVKFFTETSGIYADADKKVRPEVDIEPTVAEIKAYYQAHIAEFTQPSKAHVRQIKLRDSNFASPEEAQARLQDLRERILKGESFADVAKAESQDSATRKNGGDLGWIPLEGSPYEKFLTDFASSAEPGAISEIRRIAPNWYLFKLEERADRCMKSFEEVQSDIVGRIRSDKANAYFDRLKEQLYKQAYISCPEFPDLESGR